jgi:hypothetical protein
MIFMYGFRHLLKLESSPMEEMKNRKINTETKLKKFVKANPK